MYRFRPILFRRFSSSPISSDVVKLPVQVYGVEGRYASALYSAASKTKTLDTVEKDLKEIKSLLASDFPLREFFYNPTINRESKLAAVQLVSEKKKMTDVTKNLLEAMVENGRLAKLSSVLSSFETVMSAHRGEVLCEVTTAKALDASSRTELETTLKAFLKSGQILKYSTKVDPSIIGGMKVTIGDKYVDMSISSKLKKYTEAISAPV